MPHNILIIFAVCIQKFSIEFIFRGMRRTCFWLFLFFSLSVTVSQRRFPQDSGPSFVEGVNAGDGDARSEVEEEKEVDLAESIFRQLRLHLSAAQFPEQIRRLASAGQATIPAKVEVLESGMPTSAQEVEKVANTVYETGVKDQTTLRPIEEVLTEVVKMVIVQILADRKKQGPGVKSMSKSKLEKLIAEAVEEVEDVGREVMSPINEVSKIEIERMVMGKMVKMAKEGEIVIKKENHADVVGGMLDKNQDEVLASEPITQPIDGGNLKETALPMKQMMEVVAKTLAKEVISIEENHSEVKMSEEQAEMLMVKALSKAQIISKTEELEKAKVSPKEMAMALLVEETELEHSTGLLEKEIDDIVAEVHEQEIEEEVLATPKILPEKLMKALINKAKMNPPKVSSEEVTRETGLEESNAVLGEVIVDEVADVEKEHLDKFEIRRKKVPIKPKVEENKVVLMALLAEENELEDAEATWKAIDDMVAEMHEQEQRSEARFEILEDHSESPEPDVETYEPPAKVDSSSTSSAPTTLSTESGSTLLSSSPSESSSPSSATRTKSREQSSSTPPTATQKELVSSTQSIQDLSSIIKGGLHLAKLAISSHLPSTTRTRHQPPSSASPSTSFASSPNTSSSSETNGSTAPLSTETLSTLKPSLAASVTTPTFSKDSRESTSTTVGSSPVPSTVAPSATSKRPTSVKSSPNAFEAFQAVPLPLKVPSSSGTSNNLLLHDI